jgi:hypothetical protein
VKYGEKLEQSQFFQKRRKMERKEIDEGETIDALRKLQLTISVIWGILRF